VSPPSWYNLNRLPLLAETHRGFCFGKRVAFLSSVLEHRQYIWAHLLWGLGTVFTPCDTTLCQYFGLHVSENWQEFWFLCHWCNPMWLPHTTNIAMVVIIGIRGSSMIKLIRKSRTNRLWYINKHHMTGARLKSQYLELFLCLESWP